MLGLLRPSLRRAACVPNCGRVAARWSSGASMPPPPPMQASTEAAPHLRSVQQLSGESLFLLAAQPGGHLAASRERLRREVMQVDGVSYAESLVTVRKIAHTSAENVWLGLLPYRTGIAVAVVGGWVSLPLVFSLTVAKWFNDIAVTTDVPSVSDLETLLEVGSWTWNWMEPPLGTISFFLLCMQYARDQRINIGYKPYTDKYKSTVADRLAALYPQYDRNIVRDYAKQTAFDADVHELVDAPEPPATQGNVA